jgi:hypothetical protein
MVLNGKLSMVKCKVCSFVEKENKLFVLKFDGLQKHAKQWKVIVVQFSVKVGEYFMNLNNQHVKNEQ